MPGQYVLGETVIEEWTVFDQADPQQPLTGVTAPAGIRFFLHRTTTSGTMVAASETVTFTEIGVTGHYYIKFTPQNTGVYDLDLQELHASANGTTYTFSYSILSAGAVFLPSYANAFCAESDIERWVQQTIDATSQPSSTATAGFAEARAAVLMSLCASLGFSVTPTTITAGSRLEDILREANAIGAALDWTIAAQMRVAPNRSDRVELLAARWIEYVGDGEKKGIIGIIETEIKGSLASLATDHILSGDTLPNPNTTAPVALPIGFTMGDLF